MKNLLKITLLLLSTGCDDNGSSPPPSVEPNSTPVISSFTAGYKTIFTYNSSRDFTPLTAIVI